MIGVDDTLDDATDQTAPVWAVFGDLMAGLLGAFVLILVGVLVVQIDLVASLQQEVQKRQMEEQRRMALEKALAVPLAAGRDGEQRTHWHQRQCAFCDRLGRIASRGTTVTQKPGPAIGGVFARAR